jgi:hypothetical protein
MRTLWCVGASSGPWCCALALFPTPARLYLQLVLLLCLRFPTLTPVTTPTPVARPLPHPRMNEALAWIVFLSLILPPPPPPLPVRSMCEGRRVLPLWGSSACHGFYSFWWICFVAPALTSLHNSGMG